MRAVPGAPPLLRRSPASTFGAGVEPGHWVRACMCLPVHGRCPQWTAFLTVRMRRASFYAGMQQLPIQRSSRSVFPPRFRCLVAWIQTFRHHPMRGTTPQGVAPYSSLACIAPSPAASDDRSSWARARWPGARGPKVE